LQLLEQLALVHQMEVLVMHKKTLVMEVVNALITLNQAKPFVELL